MKELEWRTAFAFDPKRKAILFVAGDKSGGSEKEFYKHLIAKADKRFDTHLSRLSRKERRHVMSKNVNATIRTLTPRQRNQVEARAAQLIAEEMTLQQLRQASRLTQQKVAKSLRIGQEGVSKIERRSDLLISTLRVYVQAMGGQLSLVVEFPDREPVVLSGIREFNR
jgi:hypothetical protein